MAPFEPDRDTRRLLLDKARDLLVREGFGGFSLRKVASLAEVSAAAVYRHFEDKDALLSAAHKTGSDLFTSYLMRSLLEKTPEDRLRKMGLCYYEFAVENRADYELLFVVNCRNLGLEKLDEQSRFERGASFRLLVDRVVECQRSGSVREGDAEALAVSIWAGVHGMVSLFLSGHLEVPEPALRAMFQSHQDAILRGLSPV